MHAKCLCLIGERHGRVYVCFNGHFLISSFFFLPLLLVLFLKVILREREKELKKKIKKKLFLYFMKIINNKNLNACFSLELLLLHAFKI